MKLGLLPALWSALVELQRLASEHDDHQLYLNPTLDPRGLQVSLGKKGVAVDPDDTEYAVAFLDYAAASKMYVILDEAECTHRVSSHRAVFGLLW